MAPIKLQEYFNVELINNVINCSNLPKSSRGDHNKNIIPILKDYLKNNGKVTYTQKSNFGRYLAKGGLSLQYFQKDIRRYLSNGVYVDIDIVNCHPVIIEQLFIKFEINVPVFISEYNSDRENSIKKYDLTDKKDLLKILNTETYKGDNIVIRDFHNSLYSLLLPKLIDKYDSFLQKTKKDYNDLGSKIAKILQHIENEILMVMYGKCVSLGFKVGVLVFDGMMIEKSSFKEELLEVLEKEVKDNLDFDINIIEKPMEILWIPENENNKDLVINNHFSKEFQGSSLINSKYENNSLSYTIIPNKQLGMEHYGHTMKECKEYLDYKISIDQLQENHIYTLINCKKCGYTHIHNQCISNPTIYQIVLNSIPEDINNLNIIIPEDQFLQVHENDKINMLLYSSLRQEDDSICEILYELYKDTFLIIKNQWYNYNSIIWKEINETNPKEILFGIKTIKEWINLLCKKHNSVNNLTTDNMKLLSKITGNISKKLSKNNEDLSYITASKKYFSKPDLVFNTQKNLLAFINGIYDLSTFTFRNGLPEDYLSINLDYSYNEINQTKMDLINKFMEDILPIKEVREFLLLNLSSCLLGIENKEQEFYILTGRKGANGKSVLTRLIEKVFGNYFASPEPSLLTAKREKSNETNEALINLSDKRIAIMSEPNKRDKILSDNLKKFTGGDTLQARALHSKTQKIQMNLKIFMLCNTIPLLDEINDAEIRRLCIINFPNKFVDKPIRKNEKLIDLNISQKLSECLNEFFHLLIIYLKNYKEYLTSGNKIIKHKEITKQLDAYIQKNKDDIDANIYIQEFIEYKEKERINCKEAWDEFREWCDKEDKTKIKQSVLEELIENHFDIESKIYIHNNYCWKNISFKKKLLVQST